MFKLKWNSKKSVNEHLLDIHIAYLKRYATGYNVFIMLIPMSVYKHIKKVGINAIITILPDKTLASMVWIKVSQSKAKTTDYIDKRPVIAFDQFGRILWKYPLTHRLNLPKGACYV